MDVRQVFNDAAVKQEFLDRFPELAPHTPRPPGTQEGMEGMDPPGVDAAAAVADRIAEGAYASGTSPGLEAIIERFTRPVQLVQRATFVDPKDDFPNSEEIRSRLAAGRAAIERAIPSAGRIDVRNHRLSWVGTGWMVESGIVVTNRHVAREFGTRENGTFSFRKDFDRPPVKAVLDWRHEHQQEEESRFRVEEVLWIEPEGSFDVAFVRVSEEGEDGEPRPAPIELMTDEELAQANESWVAVVGYPAQDSRNDAADQQRIFDGIYNVKRVAPGKITAVVQQNLVHHDATTLGGNSGSVVLHLDSGKAAALHFGGVERDRNEGVQASRVREILERHVM